MTGILACCQTAINTRHNVHVLPHPGQTVRCGKCLNELTYSGGQWKVVHR